MIINPFRYTSLSRTNTTPDGKQLVLVIGDSRMRGTSEAPGPTLASGVAYEWYSGAEHEILANDIHNANIGSFMPVMGQLHYLRTSGANKYVFVPRGVSGSEYSTDDPANNWSSGGTLYAPAIADMDAALAHYEVDDPFLIIVGLGINDANGAGSLSQIQSDINSLYSRLTSKYPFTPIYVINTGRTTGGLASDRIVAINEYMNQASLTSPNIIRAVNLTSFDGWGMFGPDDLHLTQEGNNYLGGMLERMVASTEPTKIVKEITNWFYSDINSNNKTLLKNFIEGNIADNNWNGVIDNFQLYLSQHSNDIYNDFSFLLAPSASGITVHLGADVETNGVDGRIDTNVRLGLSRYLTATDYLKAWRFKAVLSAAGTSAHGATSNAIERCFQTSGNLIAYGSSDATATTWTGGDTKYADNTEYANGRNGGTKFLRKASTQVHSAAVAGSALTVVDSVLLGAGRPTGSWMNAQYQYFFTAKQSLLNHAAFSARCQTLISGWTT